MINVECNTKLLKAAFNLVVIFINYLFRRDPLLFGFDGNGCSMLIRTTDIDNIFSPEPEMPYKNISRKISSSQMPNVKGAVRVRQSRSYCISLKIFRFQCGIIFCKDSDRTEIDLRCVNQTINSTFAYRLSPYVLSQPMHSTPVFKKRR